MSSPIKRTHGFTIVELLIVIVVIAILAAISIVAYNGMQKRARDTIRVSDLKQVQKNLELFRVDQGRYPITPGGATWDDHWNNMRECLTVGTNCGFVTTNFSPIVSSVPNDPQDDPSTSNDSDPTYYTGYEDRTPDNYILRVLLADSNNPALGSDADGGWRSSADGGCEDPWYCIKYNWPY